MADKGAYVLSIDALEEMRNALLRYQGDVRSTLPQMTAAFGRTEARIRERAEYWRRQLQAAERNHTIAQGNLRSCESSGTRDKNGRYQAPDCRHEASALASARHQLDHTQQRHTTVQQLIKQFGELQAEYARRVQRVSHTLNHQIPAACAFLQAHRNALFAYIQVNAPRTSPVQPSQVAGTAHSVVLAEAAADAAAVTLASIVAGSRAEGEQHSLDHAEHDPAWRSNAIPQVYVLPGAAGVAVVVTNAPGNQEGKLPNAIGSYVAAQTPDVRTIVSVNQNALDDIALFTHPSGSNWTRVTGSAELLDYLYQSFPDIRSSVGPRGDTIVLTSVNEIDDRDSYVRSDADFKKAGPAELETAFQLLIYTVLPLVAVGAVAEDFDRIDEHSQRSYPNSLRRVYDLFYGSEATRLEPRTGGWGIDHGYHRLNMARRMALPYIPARHIPIEDNSSTTSTREEQDSVDL